MRLLILSTVVNLKQHSDVPYIPPYGVELDVSDPYIEDINFSIFDYDVSIIHIIDPGGYFRGDFVYRTQKLLRDTSRALDNGRTIICLPQSVDFTYGEMSAYGWLKELGIELHDNFGVNVKPSGAGRAQVIQEYLKYVPHYLQIVVKPKPAPQNVLVVVSDTEIIVGMEHQVGKGTLVILPPVDLEDNLYHLKMPRLVDVAQHYYERAQRRIPVGDAPEWINTYLVPRARELDAAIEKLTDEKTTYDRLAYVLYGSGDDLESSVALLLEQLGLVVERQPQGANIDLKAKHPVLGIGFAVEVTGIKGTIQKDSNKIPQAWQYLRDRAGTTEENDKLMIVANTECHLDPRERTRESFSPPFVKLLKGTGTLLITTLQLYEQWKAVQEGLKPSEDVVQELHNSEGPYRSALS